MYIYIYICIDTNTQNIFSYLKYVEHTLSWNLTSLQRLPCQPIKFQHLVFLVQFLWLRASETSMELMSV